MFITKISRPVIFRPIFRTAQIVNFTDDKKPPSDKNDAEEPENKPTTTETSPKSASDRLNQLLASMNTVDNVTLVKSIKVPKAGARKQKRAEKEATAEKKKPKDIVEAAKNVADLMGDSSKKTEAELLSKLLNLSDVAAGKDQSSTPVDGTGRNLSELIVGMKIDRSKKPTETITRAEFVRNTMASRRDQIRASAPSFRSRDDDRDKRRLDLIEPHPSSGSVNLFGDSLGIFKNPENLKASPDILKTWDRLYKQELKLAVTHPPANYFEKMIMWTEQGKLWRFPIDNEQGMDEEAKVDFTEHVFLEQHLEGWCPDKGPIRHFMELVCTGLSKNPYTTAQAKKEHILWYRDYFEAKKDILNEVIVQQKEAAGGLKKVEK